MIGTEQGGRMITFLQRGPGLEGACTEPVCMYRDVWGQSRNGATALSGNKVHIFVAVQSKGTYGQSLCNS